MSETKDSVDQSSSEVKWGQMKEEIAATVEHVRSSLEKPATIKLLAERLAFFRNPDPVELVAEADIDALSYWIARLQASAHLELGKKMPRELAQFASGVLEGNKKQPINRKESRKYALRDGLICHLIATAVSRGFSPTRNEATSPASACDLVAEVLREAGLGPTSYDQVRHIWSKTRRGDYGQII